MKVSIILALAIALVLISMESPAFGNPAPPNDNEGLVRQKRGYITINISEGRRCGQGIGFCREGLACEGFIFKTCEVPSPI